MAHALPDASRTGHCLLDATARAAYHRAMDSRLRIAAFGLLGVAPVAVAAAPPAPVGCTATGTKYLVPAMTEAAACDRFAATIAKARRGWKGDLTVELQFGPRGQASAKAVRTRGGRKISLPVYELAISDRHLAATDIDILAHDVARGAAQAADSNGETR